MTEGEAEAQRHEGTHPGPHSQEAQGVSPRPRPGSSFASFGSATSLKPTAPHPAWAPNSFPSPRNLPPGAAIPLLCQVSLRDAPGTCFCVPRDSLVVALPELEGPRVGHDEDGATQQGVERRGEERGEQGLNEQHGRVWARVKEVAGTQDPPRPPSLAPHPVPARLAAPSPIQATVLPAHPRPGSRRQAGYVARRTAGQKRGKPSPT